MVDSSPSLRRMAATVLQPGFTGTTAPDWVRQWIAAGLGTVVLFARNVTDAAQVAALTATLRAERPDILVAIDEEAGDVTRLESRRGSSRPGNLALGAVDDPALTEQVAHDLGQELAEAGITINYAPVADVNSNPNNPVIGVRAFGDDPHLVARHTAAWIRGMQGSGVAACAKHFPGHGDTSVDSHVAVPRIGADRIRLDAVELAPFRAAIAAGSQTIMTGHLLVPAIDPVRPATLSRAVLVDLLRDELGFTGVVVTDGIEMSAVTARFGLAGATVRALAAGVDAVCVGGEHADEATARLLRDAIVDAVTAGQLPAQRLAEAAERIERLADWTARRRTTLADGAPSASADAPARPTVGLTAARRAVRVRADGTLPLRGQPYVVEFAPPHNIATGAETPWGLREPLTRRRPGTVTVRLTEVDLGRTPDPVLAAADGHALVLVVRDLHRHPWMSAAVDQLLAARPDAVVVEMGVPVRVTGGTHLSTYGASRANAEAAAELLAGPAPVGIEPAEPGRARSAGDTQDPVVVHDG
ncbi:glycoside hydrolase family 3 protein [Micromonospora sp. LOL_023]|uniref:glycoside hydrolase family 3 protein n=1 Tax=Micromonospora sp. LOL_023 TaxID=3345418 RepID=UPI003A861D38